MWFRGWQEISAPLPVRSRWRGGFFWHGEGRGMRGLTLHAVHKVLCVSGVTVGGLVWSGRLPNVGGCRRARPGSRRRRRGITRPRGLGGPAGAGTSGGGAHRPGSGSGRHVLRRDGQGDGAFLGGGEVHGLGEHHAVVGPGGRGNVLPQAIRRGILPLWGAGSYGLCFGGCHRNSGMMFGRKGRAPITGLSERRGRSRRG
jgi:hypothetical protein